jgi:plasmid stabilization system protein ParE
MDREITFSPRAQTHLRNIVEYLFNEFGEATLRRFHLRLNKFCETVLITPDIYSFANSKRNLRRCVLTKQSIIYYRVHKNTVEIVAVFDTRQNPNRLKGLI